MAKRASTAVSLLQTVKNAMAALEAAVQKQSKDTLAAALMDLARHDQSIRRKLEQKFNVKVPPVDLVVATRAAICDATDFDEREMNTNFEIDYEAYKTIQRNFKQLIKLGQIADVMELARELMKDGSYQVEMSDEGLMSSEIEECIRLVVRAIQKSGLPARQVTDWCDAMVKASRGGLLDTAEIESLRKLVARRKPPAGGKGLREGLSPLH